MAKGTKKTAVKAVNEESLVEEPIIEAQVEEITEARPVDPEVFETKLFVEEEPEDEAQLFGEDVVPPNGEPLEEVTELTEKLEDIQTRIEEFQTIQVEPVVEEVPPVAEDGVTMGGLEYAEDYHPDPNVERTLVDKSFEEPESMYTLTPEQEEEGAQVIADMVNEQILNDVREMQKLPDVFPVVERAKESYSNKDFRHFQRTGQMPK